MAGRFRRKGTKENTTRMGGDFLEEGTDRRESPALAHVTKSQILDVTTSIQRILIMILYILS